MNTVCIVTHNRLAALERLLCSPYLLPPDGRVWVLDQGSTDGTGAFLSAWVRARADVRTAFHRPRLAGVSAARGWLVDRALAEGLRRDDALLFLDDDIAIEHPDWWRPLLAALRQSDVWAAGVEGRLVTPDWMTVPAPFLPGPVDYVSGGWCAVAGAAFIEGVQFDPTYAVCYWEDADLCFQIRARGGVVWGCGDVGLRHESHSTPSQRDWERTNRARMQAKWGAGVAHG